jgi:hypothetical protein
MAPQVFTKIGLGVTSLPQVGNVAITPLGKKQGPSPINPVPTHPNYLPSLPQVSDMLAISDSMLNYTHLLPTHLQPV